MRFLKSQYTSKYSPSDNTIRVNTYGRGVMDFNGGVLLPKGTTAQRPQLTGVRQPTDANGTIRYNTDLNEIEAYVGGNWETVRAPGASAISIETFGPGNLSDTIFGPLANVPASANNIIVLVENVFQIPTTNFTLVQNPSSFDTGEEVLTTNFNIGIEYIITNVGDTDFTLIGASANTVGTVFTATGGGGGTTGRARPTGWYLNFTSAVPVAKNVTVFFGFAN
jgi:hypothetical protein